MQKIEFINQRLKWHKNSMTIIRIYEKHVTQMTTNFPICYKIKPSVNAVIAPSLLEQLKIGYQRNDILIKVFKIYCLDKNIISVNV